MVWVVTLPIAPVDSMNFALASSLLGPPKTAAIVHPFLLADSRIWLLVQWCVAAVFPSSEKRCRRARK
jgi:hypothetical protein